LIFISANDLCNAAYPAHIMLNFRFLSADGMPIYEGDDRIWQHYKAKLEREAVIQLRPQNNPMILIMEYFPDVQIVEGPVLDGSVFFSARLVF